MVPRDTQSLDTQILLGGSSCLICINLKSLTVIRMTFFSLLHTVRQHRRPVGNIQNKVRNTEMVDEIKETHVLYTKFGDDKSEWGEASRCRSALVSSFDKEKREFVFHTVAVEGPARPPAAVIVDFVSFFIWQSLWLSFGKSIRNRLLPFLGELRSRRLVRGSQVGLSTWWLSVLCLLMYSSYTPTLNFCQQILS